MLLKTIIEIVVFSIETIGIFHSYVNVYQRVLLFTSQKLRISATHREMWDMFQEKMGEPKNAATFADFGAVV